MTRRIDISRHNGGTPAVVGYLTVGDDIDVDAVASEGVSDLVAIADESTVPSDYEWTGDEVYEVVAISDDLRAELIAAVEAADLESPDQVADLVLAAAETGGREAGLAVLRQAMAVDVEASTTYTLEMRDDASRETRTITATTLDDAREQADAETEEWIEGGEWGSAGASVRASWTLTDEAGDEVADGAVTVEIEPDHDALIRDAGGDPDCDHDWSSEGEGGCSENPGVWSTGGTSIVTAEHCTRCGLHRVTKHTGSQRNPGEHDTVTYSQPNDYDGSDD